MAFAGDISAGALIPFTQIISPRYGAGTSYDADGNLQFTTPGGTLHTPHRIDDLVIFGAANELTVMVADSDAIAAADNGAFVTAAAAANQSGLPANFGIGRGNWTHAINSGLPSQLFIETEFLTVQNTIVGVTTYGGPVVRSTLQAAGDLTLVIKNMSDTVLASFTMRLRLTHTLIG